VACRPQAYVGQGKPQLEASALLALHYLSTIPDICVRLERDHGISKVTVTAMAISKVSHPIRYYFL
jgi:hypothetical protein